MNRTLQNTADSTDIWRPDVTVATIVPRDGRFLLVEEMVQGKRVLNQPAGHLESHESLHTAACRETLEETGWTVELTGFVAVYQWSNSAGNAHFVRFTFVAKPVEHDAARPLDAGIIRACWLSRDEIAARSTELRSPMVLRGVDDFLAGRHLPLDTVVSIPNGHPA
jgi:8-oxo-dGTP pyrophosphatase MutT (NUDIX family)